MSSGPSSSRTGMRNSSNMSKYTMPVTVCWAKKRDLNAFCLEKA
jgi:hypothetical protein